MNSTRTPRNVSKPGAPLVVDVVDPQPLVRVGVAVALSHAPGFEPGEVRDHPRELPASARPVVVGVARGDADEIEAVRQLTDRGRRVLVLLPDHGWQAWAALRQHVAGGLSRLAPVARIMTALRAVANGQSYWWLEPVGGESEGSATIAGTLSARERELLGLLAVGCSDREIADQLVISVRTVWSHLERIRAKTGVRGRVELAMLAWHIEAGTLPERPQQPDDAAHWRESPQAPVGDALVGARQGRDACVVRPVPSRLSYVGGATVGPRGSAA